MRRVEGCDAGDNDDVKLCMSGVVDDSKHTFRIKSVLLSVLVLQHSQSLVLFFVLLLWDHTDRNAGSLLVGVLGLELLSEQQIFSSQCSKDRYVW